MDGRARDLRERDRLLLVQAAGCRRRAAARGINTEVFLCQPRWPAKRKAPLPTPTAWCSGTTRWSIRPATAVRTVVLLSPGPPPEGALRRQHATQSDRPIQTLTWDYPRQRPQRRSPSSRIFCRDQRLHLCRPRADRRLQGPQGRRHHRLRLLDLYRRVPKRATIRRARASRTARRAGHPPRLGFRLAQQSPRPCTTAPRPTRTASPWSERKKYDLVGSSSRQEDRDDEPDFEKTKPPDYRPDWSRTHRAWTHWAAPIRS